MKKFWYLKMTMMRIRGHYSLMEHGVGAVLISPTKQYIPMTTRLCFDCTNNTAEYEACVMGIRPAIEFGAKCLEVYDDFALIVQQVKGE